MLGVLSTASVANFDVTKLAFDHSKWVLDLGSNLGLNPLQLFLHRGIIELNHCCMMWMRSSISTGNGEHSLQSSGSVGHNQPYQVMEGTTYCNVPDQFHACASS